MTRKKSHTDRPKSRSNDGYNVWNNILDDGVSAVGRSYISFQILEHGGYYTRILSPFGPHLF